MRTTLINRSILGVLVIVATLGATGAPRAWAGGKLLATGGATQLEGSAGGGLVPWAMLAGYGSRGQNGATAFITNVDTGDYQLQATGAAFTWNDRLEISVARQDLDLGSISSKDSRVAQDTSVGQNILGMKLRVIGDPIYGDWPQVAVGVQHKRSHDFTVPEVAGAADDSGSDAYVSVGRLFLAGLAGRNVYLNGTLRWSEANQLGLLGFGSTADDGSDHEALFEGSAAMFLDRHTAIGVEYREKPNNLSAFADEDDWVDAFIAWFPSKHWSVTAAYADLGSVATLDDQRGLYLSVEAAF